MIVILLENTLQRIAKQLTETINFLPAEKISK